MILTCDWKIHPAFLMSLFEVTEEVLKESNIRYDDFMAMGVSVAGLVDARKGYNFIYRSLNQSENSFGSTLERYFKFPVYVINGSKATTLGEHRFGLAQGKDHVLAIYIDWGVGLGVILNGEVFRERQDFAGELGHIR